MNPKRDGSASRSTVSSSNRKGTSEVSSPGIDHLNQSLADLTMKSPSDDGWEVYVKKSKNRAGSSSAKTYGSQNNPRAWNHQNVQRPSIQINIGSGQGHGDSRMTPAIPDSRRPSGRGSSRSQSSNRNPGGNHVTPHSTIPPPLEHGWKWAAARKQSSKDESQGKDSTSNIDISYDEERESNDDDVLDPLDDSDNELCSDEFDSDTSEKSHETRKMNRWFKRFFESLDALSIEQINEPARQWHCPACQGGPGAIDWFRGLQPLVTHAKTKSGKRMLVHRELVQLIEEELSRRGTSVVPSGETFGKWIGLDETLKDKEIVWPPIVVIMNTRLEKDENDKWTGMGNEELLDYFSSYAAVRARHSYGPQGHRGMSILIFEASAVGYIEAERLSKHFEEQGTDKDAWERRRVPFYPGGKRQLYGYMAEKSDLDYFNQHSQGKSKLKFEMRSYQEMVVSQMKQMNEDNQQLIWFKSRVEKEKKHSKALKESFGLMSAKLQKTLEENKIVRLRTKMQHEQNKEEMDSQEQFFKDQIRVIHETRESKEDNFEKIQQEERKKVKQSNINTSSMEDRRCRVEEIENFIKFQDKEMEEYVAEKEKLLKIHEEKMVSMRQRHWEQEVELEKEFDVELNLLMETYTPRTAS